MTYTLVLLRHGESEWNAKNLFTGWVDVALTEKGRGRGRRAAASCCARPGCCPTSCTPRCCAARSRTAAPRARRRRPALDPGAPLLAAQRAPLRRPAGQGQEADPRGVRRGAVHALAPLATTTRRRRSTTTTSSPRPATRATPTSATRCRAPSASRTSSRGCCPTGTTRSCRDLRAGQTVLVAAHGNALRALVKHLDGISDEDIAGLNIPTGIPLVYELDERPAPDRSRAASTSTPRPPPRPPRPSPTRALSRVGRRRG